MLAVIGVKRVLAVGALLSFERALVAVDGHRNNLIIISQQQAARSAQTTFI